MKIGKVIESGFAYGLFTAMTMAVPIAIAGTIYGCVTVIHNIKENRKNKKNDIVLKTEYYKEV